MPTALDALAELCPPPADPRPAWPRLSWPELFDRLGTPLPPDYVALVDRYGPGNLCAWVQLPDPLQADGSLADTVSRACDLYREFRAESPDWFPLAAWPEPGGFLPCANTDSGDMLG
jgi:hypothetical protein